MPKPALWIGIKDQLEDEITSGLYPPGARLPTEAAFSTRFGVNRHTIRRALGALAEAGLVHARRGSGVFVQEDVTNYAISDRVRFHQNLEADGKLPSKSILSIVTRPASTAEAAALGIGHEAEVHCCEGLSLADGHPIAHFTSLFPAAPFPELPGFLNEFRSVTRALKACGVPDFTRATTRITARQATAPQAHHLRLRDGAPVIRVESINTAPNGQRVEYGRTFFAGDRVTLTVGESLL